MLNKEGEWVCKAQFSRGRFETPFANLSLANDDSEKINKLVGMIGCAVLTMLNEFDRAGHLKPDSKFQDLALVMLMTLKWASGQEDLDEEQMAWRNTVVAYAKKGSIDLESTPLGGAEKFLNGIDEEQAEEDLGPAEADRWGWKEKVSRALISHITLGDG